jgi:hypothetical protein
MFSASAIISRNLVCQSGTEAHIRIGIGRLILEVQRKRPGIRTIVPIATTFERENRRRPRREIGVEDADVTMLPPPVFSIL